MKIPKHYSVTLEAKFSIDNCFDKFNELIKLLKKAERHYVFNFHSTIFSPFNEIQNNGSTIYEIKVSGIRRNVKSYFKEIVPLVQELDPKSTYKFTKGMYN
jgi:hypothetical protein